jgi:catechol 2,3-dioxygenase-like lactoylglutathione lyase family enzyme
MNKHLIEVTKFRMRLSGVIVGLLILVQQRALAADTKPGMVQSLDAVSMTVSDLDRAVDFYSRVLTFEKVSETEVAGETVERVEGVFGVRMRVARMRLGDEFIELSEYVAPKGRPIPDDARSNDRSFQHVAIIVSDMDKAYQRLRSFKVEFASSGPQLLPDWNKNAGGISAFYFKDPDGHPVEILHFPADKGAAKWHDAARFGDKLFLGIDHTAIVVSDTDASLKFYRDVLGMQVAGESENYGTEQEHLNNVFGAHLRITALRAASGPGIEFLEYLSPRDGQPYPRDERANDIVHRQTELVTPDADAAAAALRAAKVPFVSSDVATDAERRLGYKKAFLVRDPDGHAVLIEQR